MYDGDKGRHHKNQSLRFITVGTCAPARVVLQRFKSNKWVWLLVACLGSFLFGFLHRDEDDDISPLGDSSHSESIVNSSSSEKLISHQDNNNCSESNRAVQGQLSQQQEQTIRNLRRKITRLTNDLTESRTAQANAQKQPQNPRAATSWGSSFEPLSDNNDAAAAAQQQQVANVLQWDHAAMQYARLSYDGTATLTWLDHGGNQGDEAKNSPLRATPMLATVDRRATLQRNKQACAVASFVAVSHTDELDLFSVNNQTHVLPKPEIEMEPSCAVCYQWANHIVAQQQVIELVRFLDRDATVYRPYDLGMEDTTVCVTGKASFAKRQRWRSARWHSLRSKHYHQEGHHEDERDSAHGFVWGLWCELPEALDKKTDGSLTTSCASLHPSLWSPELQRVYYTSSFTLQTRKKTIDPSQDDENKVIGGAQVRVDASWPWRSLVLDERKYDAPPNLPLPRLSATTGNTDLNLLWAEGPLWQRQDFGPDMNRLEWNMSFAMTLKRSAPSGIGERFLLSILQQATIAPGSTRLLGVVDSHTNPTFNELVKMLNQPVTTWLPWCQLFNKGQGESKRVPEALTLVYTKACISRGNPNNKNAKKVAKDTTLGQLLERRRIKIKLVPYPIRPSLFGTVRQMGQSAYAAWLGLRFSPEYHAILYMDSDAIPFVNPQTHGSEKAQVANKGKKPLQNAIFQRLFQEANPCVSQRFEALEYEVVQQSIETELKCANHLLTDPKDLNRTLTYCTKEKGHVLARSDALGMLWIHDNYAEPEDLPPATRNCVQDEELTFPPPLVVEVHLRSRGRKRKALRRCSCKV